ncbi:DUF1501 domain-containing protein [Schlesneria sp. T3-172]|uniref:DUF1501 domain-containing protein n=1 Tax=Schlesneria sphaerica TaxID=3373610 RepID=UPI0037C64836
MSHSPGSSPLAPDHPCAVGDCLSRRSLLTGVGSSLGFAALSSLSAEDHSEKTARDRTTTVPHTKRPHAVPRAKRVIFLFQSGGPSQLELFDPKPELKARQGEDLPESIRRGQRLTNMTAGQSRFPVVPSRFQFSRHGESGATLSELLPHLGHVADDICFIKSMSTEAINHDPAVTFLTTGAQLAGRPSLGSWLSYGLGSENQDLPAFVVMLSRGTGRPNDQPLYDRLWGSGFLPSQHQGVKLRSGNEPVLYLANPAGIDPPVRRGMLDDQAALNRIQLDRLGDPEIEARIAQYELAFRMQTSVPDLANVSDESDHTFELYGPNSRKPGTFAANCLLARRLAERGVRFIQLFHMGWDQHTNLPSQIPQQAHDIDQPCAALIRDLKQRGLLDDTLIVWSGEFGRTVYCQGNLTAETYGRDHHPRCFTMWMTGGGVRGGLTYGETDEYSYNVSKDPVHVHDLNATILHCLGIDHHQLTFKFQGRHFRLTDVHGELIRPVLA